MKDWNVAGEIVNPKNITVGSNDPLFVQNVAFHSSPSFIWILLYPQCMSSLVKIVTSLRVSINSEINGRGYWFFIMASLSFR